MCFPPPCLCSSFINKHTSPSEIDCPLEYAAVAAARAVERLSLVADTITIRSHRIVVMSEARAGGERGTASSSSTPVLLLAWQQTRLVLNCCLRYICTRVASNDVWKPTRFQIQSRVSIVISIGNGAPFPTGGRLKMIIEKFDRKWTHFQPRKRANRF